MKKSIFTVITILAAALSLTISASAQGKKARGMNARLFDLVQAAKQGRAKLSPAIAKQVRDDFNDSSKDSLEFAPPIVGTWYCKVAESDQGFPPFEAYHNFGADGTFVETSSLLGLGGEGPAHGVYEPFKRGYVLTFELFVFDPETGESVGRVRVRVSIRMSSSNTFNALTAVDFIEPDGATIEDIDGGPFSATRVQVRGL
jgi:hypothetical protein